MRIFRKRGPERSEVTPGEIVQDAKGQKPAVPRSTSQEPPRLNLIRLGGGRVHITYLPYRDELARRCVFARDADGRGAGTVTGWWNATEERREPSVHWVAVHPDYQGLGLAKALVSQNAG